MLLCGCLCACLNVNKVNGVRLIIPSRHFSDVWLACSNRFFTMNLWKLVLCVSFSFGLACFCFILLFLILHVGFRFCGTFSASTLRFQVARISCMCLHFRSLFSFLHFTRCGSVRLP